MPTLDPVKNFAKVTVSIGYDASATSIALSSGDGAKLPVPSTDGSFNLTWWNSTDYSDPSDDPNAEIVRCTARSTDTLTVTRAQESTSASTKNTSGKTYQMVLAPTKKLRDDIEAGFQPLDSDLTALAGLSSTGMISRTGSGTASVRTITGTSNRITVTNGDGVSGNPTLDVGSSVYTAGGTDVAVADGGTNISSYTKGDILVATGTTTLTKLAVGSDTQVLTADSTQTSGVKWAAAGGGGGTDYSCRIYQTGATSLTTSWVSIAFGAENFDTDTMHDNVTNNTRITFTHAGKYCVGASIRIAGNTVAGARIRLNGSTILATQKQGNSGDPEHVCVSTIYSFSAADYIEIQGYASTINTSGDSETSAWAFNIT